MYLKKKKSVYNITFLTVPLKVNTYAFIRAKFGCKKYKYAYVFCFFKHKYFLPRPYRQQVYTEIKKLLLLTGVGQHCCNWVYS